MTELGIIIGIALVASLAGLIAAHVMRTRGSQSAAARRLLRLEDANQGSVAVGSVLMCMLGALSSLNSTWKRQEQVVDTVKKTAPER